MELTLEKLLAGMTVSGFSQSRQDYILARWKPLAQRIEKYIQAVMVNWPEMPEDSAFALPDGLSEAEQTVFLSVAYCFMTEPALQCYLDKGCTEQMWREAMHDIIWHCHDRADGSFWLDTAPNGFGWEYSILNAYNVLLGRLQFYPTETCLDFPELGIADGTPAIGFHIPASGPLDTQECIVSFRMAQDFFDKFMPGWNYQGFFCRSWFLNPIYRKYLPPTSNIVKFQKLGNAIYYPNDTRDCLRRVFKFRGVDVNDPNPPTTMQRVIQQIMRDGGPIGAGAIFIPKFER